MIMRCHCTAGSCWYQERTVPNLERLPYIWAACHSDCSAMALPTIISTPPTTNAANGIHNNSWSYTGAICMLKLIACKQAIKQSSNQITHKAHMQSKQPISLFEAGLQLSITIWVLSDLHIFRLNQITLSAVQVFFLSWYLHVMPASWMCSTCTPWLCMLTI